MDPLTRAMFMGSAGAGGIDLPEIGAAFEGGYYAGLISYTADGVATHALIVAPAASGYNGESKLQWKTSNTSSSGTSSEYDGAANTANMADASHPAANYCAGLSIGGYSDWYLPARYEIEIAYYNLKPTTTSNNTGYGTNSYAVPQRGSNYTAGDPAQTSVSAFQSGGAEDFLADFHWSSTENSSTNAWVQSFTNGYQFYNDKNFNGYCVRAFRKVAL